MELVTQRLVLREFVPSDWRDVLAYQSDALYLRFYEWESRSESEARAFVQMFLGWQLENPRSRYQLAMILQEEDRLIGNAGIRVNDSRLLEANIGYEVDSRYWGRGYASEAARALLTFGFESLTLHRIWAHCLAENSASARVLEKIGMHLEGREREKEWIKGRWHDRLTYAILDREWTG